MFRMALAMAFHIGFQLTAVPEPDGHHKRHDDRQAHC
jgi:hypothetical protein